MGRRVKQLTKQAVINAVIISLSELLPTDFVPNPATRGKGSTGNLAFNAIRCEITSKEIIVRVNPAIAPYMPYTTEPWISPRRNGKKNPNEGWWDRFAKELVQRVANKLGGHVK